jgi:hypothetical protein
MWRERLNLEEEEGKLKDKMFALESEVSLAVQTNI